ncbi:hypothetical protein [Lysobacter gummosus]|uniref:hypothetical protein n=1 Tax=Lysobacter gummosus TaxID=262324 RepID=UPI00363FBF5F
MEQQRRGQRRGRRRRQPRHRSALSVLNRPTDDFARRRADLDFQVGALLCLTQAHR